MTEYSQESLFEIFPAKKSSNESVHLDFLAFLAGAGAGGQPMYTLNSATQQSLANSTLVPSSLCRKGPFVQNFTQNMNDVISQFFVQISEESTEWCLLFGQNHPSQIPVVSRNEVS